MSRRRNHVYSLETLERRDCPAGFTLTPLNQIVSEGNSADFELTLDAVSAVPESVIVTSKSGTAIIGSDFMQRTQRITFSQVRQLRIFQSKRSATLWNQLKEQKISLLL